MAHSTITAPCVGSGWRSPTTRPSTRPTSARIAARSSARRAFRLEGDDRWRVPVDPTMGVGFGPCRALPHCCRTDLTIRRDRRSAPAPSDPASSHTSQSSTLPTLACAQFVNEGRFPRRCEVQAAPSGVWLWKIPLISLAALMSERRGSALGARADRRWRACRPSPVMGDHYTP